MAHQRTFHYIERYDRPLAWLNVFFLLFVALMPFPTSVLGAYGDQLVAVILYATTLAITGLLLSVLWLYASYNHRLVAKMLTTQHIRATTLRNAVPPLVFLASIGIAFASIRAAEATWVHVLAINVVSTAPGGLNASFSCESKRRVM
jgi:uncharacterized membrane protein